MKIISHRGGAKLAPENSLEAIKVSKTLKVDAVEIDIHITKDKKLVVVHDPDLKRLAGIDKRIDELDLSEIKKVELHNGTAIPTLTEAIDFAGDMPLFIEGKGGNWSKLLFRELNKHHFKIKPTVISFNDAELAKFHDLTKSTSCFNLEIFRGLKAISTAKKHGFNGIDIHFLALNPLVYRAAKKNNLKIVIYLIDNKSIAKFINKLYPDVAITTDRPDNLLNLVKNINA